MWCCSRPSDRNRVITEQTDPVSTAAVETEQSARVEVAGVTKSFSGEAVLRGVNLDVEPGSTVALLGPSGCGKTTLLRVIAGLEPADDGVVVVGDRVLTGPGVFVPPEERRVGLVFQDWALFPHLNVARNVGFGLPRSERRSSPRIDEALHLVGMEEFADRMPDTLSGGQQQRVALARAVAPRPRVLLLDEPFSNLDATMRVRVRNEIHELLHLLGITSIFVTHDQDEAFVLGDRVAVVNAGAIVQTGSPEEIYERPSTPWVAGFVGAADFVTGQISSTAPAIEVTTMFGRLPVPSPGTDDATGTAVGSMVSVLVRPEHLRVSVPDATDNAPHAPGVVRAVEYVGRDTVYAVESAGAVLRARALGPPLFAVGDPVLIHHHGGPVRVFGGSAESPTG